MGADEGRVPCVLRNRFNGAHMARLTNLPAIPTNRPPVAVPRNYVLSLRM